MAKEFDRIPSLTGFGVLPAELVLHPTRTIVIRYPTEGGAKFDVLRADDLLVLNFDIGSFPKPYIKVTFPPQSFAEQAVSNPPSPPPPSPVGCYMSGPSQLVFVPKPGWKIAEIPLLPLASLLDWNSFGDPQLSNGPLSLAGDGVSPDGTLTCIEAPYGLLLSPLPRVELTLTLPEPQHGLLSIPSADARETPTLSGFTHRALSIPSAFAQPIPIFENNQSPVEHGGITELWHARGNVDYVTAIFSGRGDLPDPDLIALSAGNRKNVATNSTSAHSANKIQSRLLLLSSLGAWLDVVGSWPDPSNLTSWVHRSTLGRDQHVVTVNAGILYPFGHRASLVITTERSFPPNGKGPLYLVQNQYLVVTEPVKEGFDTHRLPFKSVEILTRVTPNFTQDSISATSAFWPQINGPNGADDYKFHLKGTDAKGGEVHFSLPLIFDPSEDGLNPDVATAYQTAKPGRRTADDLGGIPVAYGDSANSTVLNTLALTLDGQVYGSPPTPGMGSANVRIPAVTHLVGQEQPVDFFFSKNFTDQTSNPATEAGVFGVLKSDVNFQFGSTDQSGGFIAPTMNLRLLSHQYGPMVGKEDDLTKTGLNPAQYLKDFKLLGSFTLSQILNDIQPPIQLPTITADSGGATLNWTNVSLKDYGVFKGGAASALDLTVAKVLQQNGQPSQTKIHASLTNFSIEFPDIIQIVFNNIVFDHQPNQKMSVTANLTSVTFKGALQFLELLQEAIPSNGFSNPPALEVTPAGAELSYSLGLPPIQMGVFALQNVNLGASLRIPFQGDPLTFGFNFATPEKPFLLTVEALGGGGYFNVDLSAAGVQALNVALEFGGSLAIDLGVASGGVTITGGFHFGLKLLGNGSEDIDFTAFLQASGDVNVLDLVSVSVEFYMGLDYDVLSNEFTGTATLTVEVDVMFFHEAVDLSMSKSFAA